MIFRSIAALAFASYMSAQVSLFPGNNIQAVVDAHPPGTSFTLTGGIYRQQSIVPKSGDFFQGLPGAVLDGAKVLPSGNWFTDGTLWADPTDYTAKFPGWQQNGFCDAAHPACTYPEDLFYDNIPKNRALPNPDCPTAMHAAGSGSWCIDYGYGIVYSKDDPTGHTVELSATRSAFSGSASRVRIVNLTVEKYAVPGQFGAIGDQYPGTGWTIERNVVRWNHGAGINVTTNARIINNFIHDNGEKGVGAGGGNVLIQGNEISGNNYAGFGCNWECGGVKAAQVNGYTVQSNYVHDNAGPGLWTDIDSIYVSYTGNDVRNNKYEGIAHEISYDAAITNNILCGNYDRGAGVTSGPNLSITTSRNVRVDKNRFVITGEGNVIYLHQDGRMGTVGAYGVHALTNDRITNGDISVAAPPTPGFPKGLSMIWWDAGSMPTGNTFDSNHYHVQDPGSSNYSNFGGYLTFANWQAIYGFDVHGSVDSTVGSCPAPIAAGPGQ